ncbi:MAG: tetratricopeptide repeat protein, partial [Terriglobales bacterium]
DLLRAHLLRQYDRAALRPSILVRSLDAIRQRLPGLGDPVAGAGLGLFAGRVELRLGGTFMDALSGQLRLPFEQHAGASPRQFTLVQSPQAKVRAEAEQWFAFGLSLEGEPELRDQAAAAYERCLQLDSHFTSAHINLGTLRYQQKDFAAAEGCYRAALALDADYALAHFNLGNVLDETGRLEDAILAYLAAVRLVPNYADAHYNLALAYQRQGQPRRAVPHWQQYLGLYRQSAWADHARTQLKQALAKDALKIVGVNF